MSSLDTSFKLEEINEGASIVPHQANPMVSIIWTREGEAERGSLQVIGAWDGQSMKERNIALSFTLQAYLHILVDHVLITDTRN
jgi:hypothetical protein